MLTQRVGDKSQGQRECVCVRERERESQRTRVRLRLAERSGEGGTTNHNWGKARNKRADSSSRSEKNYAALLFSRQRVNERERPILCV